MLQWIYTWDWYAINLCVFLSLIENFIKGKPGLWSGMGGGPQSLDWVGPGTRQSHPLHQLRAPGRVHSLSLHSGRPGAAPVDEQGWAKTLGLLGSGLGFPQGPFLWRPRDVPLSAVYLLQHLILNLILIWWRSLQWINLKRWVPVG